MGFKGFVHALFFRFSQIQCLFKPRKSWSDRLKTIECLCLGTIGLIVAPWKFDVFKTSIFVLRTSNFRGAAISR